MTANHPLRAAAALLLFTAIRTSAHHSFAAEYDENTLITVSGSVSRFEWINPHALLFVNVTDAAGKAGSWKFEMGSPGGLESRGWKKTDLRTGDRITVEGYAAKDGSNIANARMVKLADGRKLFGGFECTPGNPSRFPIPGNPLPRRRAWNLDGPAQGPFPPLNLPPTNRATSATGMVFWRIRDGQIVKRWGNLDRLSLQRQLTAEA